MLKDNDTQLLSVKELAWRLNSHPNYVYLMRKAGFPMPGNRTMLEEALAWLEATPSWRRRPGQEILAGRGGSKEERWQAIFEL